MLFFLCSFPCLYPYIFSCLSCDSLIQRWIPPPCLPHLPFLSTLSFFVVSFCPRPTTSQMFLFHFFRSLLTLSSQRAYPHPIASSSSLLHLHIHPPPPSYWPSVYWRRWPVGRQNWEGSGKKLIVSGRDKQPARASSTVYPSCQHST